jgi:hypothetical protein
MTIWPLSTKQIWQRLCSEPGNLVLRGALDSTFRQSVQYPLPENIKNFYDIKDPFTTQSVAIKNRPEVVFSHTCAICVGHKSIALRRNVNNFK